MITFKPILIFFVFLLTLAACNSRVNTKHERSNPKYYIEDRSVSNSDGTPKDSLIFYFPATLQGRHIFKSPLDTFNQDIFSSALFAFKEPILYNYYQGHDIYRLLWLRSFHRPVVFVLHKEKGHVWLAIKILNKRPQIVDISLTAPIFNGTDTSSFRTSPDSLIKADRKADIEYSKRLDLTSTEWSKFEALLNQADFWTTSPTEDAMGLDGSEWIMEAQMKERYHFVQRWSPEGKFRTAGEYLIKLSGLKEDVY